MVKMVSMKCTKDDYVAENASLGMPRDEGGDGFEVHLDEPFLKKLGLHDDLPHGHEIELHAEGRLVSSHMREGSDGEAHRGMTFRFHRAGVEHTEPEESHGASIRADLSNSYEKHGKKK